MASILKAVFFFAPAATIFFFGCGGRIVPFTRTAATPEREEPEWVFLDQGHGEYEGRDVIYGVGVDSRGIDYRRRLQNALDGARKRLESEIRDFLAGIEDKVAGELQAPKPVAERLPAIMETSAGEVAGKLSEKARHVSTHESLLRREVFVKVVVETDEIKKTYDRALREKLAEYF